MSEPAVLFYDAKTKRAGIGCGGNVHWLPRYLAPHVVALAAEIEEDREELARLTALLQEAHEMVEEAMAAPGDVVPIQWRFADDA
jgi:hypothetical protein